MNPKKAEELVGARLAFAQGGEAGTRLVFLTPPIERVQTHMDCAEALWSSREMPFRYLHAPLLIDSEGNTEFPLLKELLRDVARASSVAQFASAFRANTKALPRGIAQQLIQRYQQRRAQARADGYCGELRSCPSRTTSNSVAQPAGARI